jgi:O-antigen/teichoic acid export membrane protein
LLGPLALYGGPEALSSMVLMLLLHAEKLLIPVFSSTRSLAYYSVAFSLASILTVVPHAINVAALPAFSGILADGDTDRVNALFSGLLRINLLWIVPAILLAVTGGRAFISLWAGATYTENCILPFYILLVGVFVETTTSIAHVLLQALGRTDLVLRITLVQAVPYFLCVVLATYYLGPVGAALAWTLRGSANAFLRVWVVRRVIRLSPNLLPRGSAAYARAVAVLIVPPILASAVGGPAYAVVTLAAVVAHLAVVWAKVLTVEDKARARDFFLRLRAVGA